MAILQVNNRPANSLRRALNTPGIKPISNKAMGQGTRQSSKANDNEIYNHTTQEISEKSRDAEANIPVQQEHPETETPQPPQEPEVSIWQRIVWTLMPSTTVGRALISATERLKESGHPSPQLDAQVILAYVLKQERSWLFAHYDYKLSAEEAKHYTSLIVRRMANEPVAYLIGRREFYGLEIHVDQRVLIPRPETELLVDAVIDHIRSRSEQQVSIADIGTGSGAIAIAVATYVPEAKLYAIDVSLDALAVARANSLRLDRRRQITFLHGDLLAPLPNPMDIIVANLPYINSGDYTILEPDVRDYEPQLALEAGPEGLDLITRLLKEACACLNPGGIIFLEIGYDQGPLVLDLVRNLVPNTSYVGLRQDHHGQDRLVIAAL